jgi:hypothetical protein
MGLSHEIVMIDRPHKLSFGHAGATVTKRGKLDQSCGRVLVAKGSAPTRGGARQPMRLRNALM